MFHFEEPTVLPQNWKGPFLFREKEKKEKNDCGKYVVVSDMHDDCRAGLESLRRSDVLNAHGEWEKNGGRVHIIVTGDSVDKDYPSRNRKMFHFLRGLQETVPEGSEVTVLVGNHEIDLLLRELDGEKCLRKKDIHFLQTCGVVCKKGSILFLHGYPTRELVYELVTQYRENDGNVDNFDWTINRRFSKAVGALLEGGLSKEEIRKMLISFDIGTAKKTLGGLTEEEYYKKYGREISLILQEMGITLVVHGHKKNISGGQQVETYIPNVCMINGDVALSKESNPKHNHRVGSVTITTHPDRHMQIACLYSKKFHSITQTRYGDIH